MGKWISIRKAMSSDVDVGMLAATGIGGRLISARFENVRAVHITDDFPDAIQLPISELDYNLDFLLNDVDTTSDDMAPQFHVVQEDLADDHPDVEPAAGDITASHASSAQSDVNGNNPFHRLMSMKPPLPLSK